MAGIITFCFNAFQENTQVIYQTGGEAIVVDPGNYSETENETLTSFFDEQHIQPVRIINTHCHVDHVLGVQFLKSRYGIPFLIHAGEEPVLRSVALYASNWGFREYAEPAPDQFLSEGEIINLGDSAWEILHIPGHSPGHIVLYDKGSDRCIAGDVLFRNSIGRTDLPGGDHDLLISGIRKKLYTLPDEVEIFPGHGPNTRLGTEKKHNPFCRAE